MLLSVCHSVAEQLLPLADFLALAQQHGYDAVELLGEPSVYDVQETKELLCEHGLRVSSLTACARIPTNRDLASPYFKVRRQAVKHFCSCIELARSLAIPNVGILPTVVGVAAPRDGWNAEWSRAVEAVAEIAGFAKECDIILNIELLNRYASFLVKTVEDGLNFIEATNSSQVTIGLDFFHMNIEEADIAESIRLGGRAISNIHVSDSNRRGIGCGHIDFQKIFDALQDIKYKGFLALEAWPPTRNPFSTPNVENGSDLKTLITYIREFPSKVLR